MAGKSNYSRRKKILNMVLYIVIVLILIMCLIFFIDCARHQQMEYRNTVQQAIQDETGYETKWHRVETECETDTQTDVQTEVQTESVTEAKSETVMQSENQTEAKDKSVSIVILNGTGRSGVAGYWQSQLEADGYINVVSASYYESAEEKTVIYTQDEKLAEPLKKHFPDAIIQKGAIKEGIVAGENVTIPDRNDLYIVVGNSDARNE